MCIDIQKQSNMSNKIYPIGIQNFESLRQDGYFYIDKTALIYQLVKTGRYYFLSRPRRFGKSLLVSTLKAYFQGKKELFTGLAMEKLEKDWITYPILHIDLNIEKYDTAESLDNILEKSLAAWEKLYGADPSERSSSLRFAGIIERACKQTGQRVVILIDEYDKPMFASHRKRRTSETIPEHLEAILRSTENDGWLHQVRPADRSDQIRKSQRIQRLEQSGRHIHVEQLYRNMWYQRTGNP